MPCATMISNACKIGDEIDRWRGARSARAHGDASRGGPGHFWGGGHCCLLMLDTFGGGGQCCLGEVDKVCAPLVTPDRTYNY